MIKQSFLRNYSLSKINHQTEDQKNKLKVFYLRKVRKILKEKHENQRATQREKLSRQNKEERIKRRLQCKMNTEFCDPPEHDTIPKAYFGRSRTSANNRDKASNKPDLNLVELKFENYLEKSGGSLLRNEKLKALRVKLNSSMIHSEKKGREDFFEIVGTIMRNNTVNRAFSHQRGMEMNQGRWNNHSILFYSQQAANQGQSQCGPRRAVARQGQKIKSQV